MCLIKQISTKIKAFCKRNSLKAVSTCMHGPVEFVHIFEVFQSDFIDFYVNKKTKLKKVTFSPVFFIDDMPRILQNLRKRATDMLNAGMTMNAIAMHSGCSIRAIRHRAYGSSTS